MSKPQTLPPADKENLKNFLKGFYSIGQLRIIYSTLTDGSPYPGLTDFERAARIEAIEDILKISKMPPEPQPKPEVEQEALPEVKPETTVLYSLEKAQIFGKIVVDMLEDYCDKIYIAGSIRRQKPQIKDVEVVCQPKRFAQADFSLFGGTQELKVAPAFKRTVENDLGDVLKGKADGRYMQIKMHSGIKLDLFMPAPHDFYRQYAIRTGSADYSAKVIAGGWKALGWCGTDNGLRLISECEETKSGWKCLSKNPTLPPAWQSEKEFFAWLKVPYLEPQKRI